MWCLFTYVATSGEDTDPAKGNLHIYSKKVSPKISLKGGGGGGGRAPMPKNVPLACNTFCLLTVDTYVLFFALCLFVEKNPNPNIYMPGQTAMISHASRMEKYISAWYCGTLKQDKTSFDDNKNIYFFVVWGQRNAWKRLR